MNQTKNRIAYGVCLSDWDKHLNFRFDCMNNMKESFCMLRIGRIECDHGTFYEDKCFKEYVETCNKLSIPWVGYIYLHMHTDSRINRIFLPNYDVWDIFKDMKFSIPYITFILDFNLPNLTIDRINTIVRLLENAIQSKMDKQFITVCSGFTGSNESFAEHSEFKYPLYTEVVLPESCSSFSVPNNTVLCWYGDRTYSYSTVTVEDKFNIDKTSINLGSVVALGELADAIHNYRGIE